MKAVRAVRAVAAVTLLLTAVSAVAAASAQSLRVSAWGSYDGVTGSEDWTTAGSQLTLTTARGHAVWAAAELVGRFGTTDGSERLGGMLHPGTRVWITVEAGTAAGPELVPKNSWETDVSALVAPRASLGLGYRRLNYVVGPVDIVMPHVAVDTRAVSWDGRVFVSRNPSDRTDLAFLLRATVPLARRAAAWLGIGAGRESFLVGAPPAQQVRSLDTVTGTAGLRYNAASRLSVRVDATVVRSRPVLSRRGVRVGVERQF